MSPLHLRQSFPRKCRLPSHQAHPQVTHRQSTLRQCPHILQQSNQPHRHRLPFPRLHRPEPRQNSQQGPLRVRLYQPSLLSDCFKPRHPTPTPTEVPTPSPTHSPTDFPTPAPTQVPSAEPTTTPTQCYDGGATLRASFQPRTASVTAQALSAHDEAKLKQAVATRLNLRSADLFSTAFRHVPAAKAKGQIEG